MIRRLAALAFVAALGAALGAAALAPPAAAMDGQRRYYVIGSVATATCLQYGGFSAEQIGQFEFWMAGYLTAMNRLTPDTYDLVGTTKPEQIHAWLRQHCQQNPNQLMAVAVHALAEALHPQRVRMAPN